MADGSRMVDAGVCMPLPALEPSITGSQLEHYRAAQSGQVLARY